MVDVWPLFTSVGLAVNWVITGMIGAAVTVTATAWVAVVPLDAVAVMVKVVVAVIVTVADPEVASAVVPVCTAGAIVTDVALVVAQVMVVVWPAVTAVGLALNCVIWGVTGGGVVLVPLLLHPSCKRVRSAMPKPTLRIYV